MLATLLISTMRFSPLIRRQNEMQALMKSELETRLQKLESRLMGQMKTAAATEETGTSDFIELLC